MLADGGTLTAISGSASAPQQVVHGTPEQQLQSGHPRPSERGRLDAGSALSSAVAVAAAWGAASFASKATLWAAGAP